MKNAKLLIPCIALLVVPLTSCDLFEKAGDIHDYVATYTLEAAYERTYHVYWGSEKLTSEKELSGIPKKIVILETKKVTYWDDEGNEKTGKVKCMEKYCRFYSLPFSSSYKFDKRYDNSLSYSYESTHMSVEYDVTHRHILYRRADS